MTKMKAWVLAARPKTLTASVLPIVATTGMVYGLNHEIQWWIVACALLSSFCIQIGTNFVNDAMDFKKGADKEGRLGPMRVTQQGHFTFKQVMLMATAFFVLATAFGVPLVMHGGMPIAIIGLLSILMGYAYTSGPMPLAYFGLGDLFVILFFGLVAVCGFHYLLTLELFSTNAIVLGLQVGFLNTILIAINNLRDIEGDRLVNKKTLAVYLGKTGARIWIGFLCIAPFLMGYYWLNQHLWYVYGAPLITFPLGMSIAKKIFRNEPGVIYNKFLGQSAGYGLLFSILIAIGFQIK
ncbi:MAG: 1,4-dihydroxy-2-naphthoate octaprenyltransferase [Bdellovibrio sp.]|nr:1,4-dihydroxy-2-naphthoate octaprenyltransferase [Bdellovibrio sp.]